MKSTNSRSKLFLAIVFVLYSTLTFTQTKYPPKEDNGKWGIWNNLHNCWVYKPTYDKVVFENDFYKLTRNDSTGMMDSHFSFKLPLVYEDIYYDTENYILAAKKDGKWGCVNQEGEVQINFQYAEIKAITRNRLKVSDGKSFGVTDLKGKNIIPIEFEKIEFFKDKNYYAEQVIQVTKHNKVGLMNLDGESLLACNFLDLIPNLKISENIPRPNLFPVKNGGKWGFANPKGVIAIPCKYQEVSPFYKGVAIAQVSNKYILINETGKIISKQSYSNIQGFNPDNDISKVRLDGSGKEGIVNLKGFEILPPEYSVRLNYRPDTNRRKARRSKSMRSIGNKTSDKHFKYGDLAPTLVMFSTSDRKMNGLIDHEGNYILPLKENAQVKRFKYGIFYPGNKIANGDDILLFQEGYKSMSMYSKNEYIVKTDSTIALIDILTNQVIIPPIYDNISSNYSAKQHPGLYLVSKDKKMALIDQKNKILIPFEYNKLSFLKNTNILLAHKDSKYGLLKINGEVITDFIYDKIKKINYGFIKVQKDGQTGIVDSSGNIVIPMTDKKIGIVRLYSKTGILHRNDLSPSTPLPDSLQFVATSRYEKSILAINTKGEVIDTIPMFPKRKPGVGNAQLSYTVRNGVYQLQASMSSGNPLYGKDIPQNVIEEEMQKSSGFIPYSFQRNQIIDSYLLIRTNKVVTFEKIQQDHDLNSPLRWVKQGKYYSLINQYGEHIVPFEYQKVGPYSEELISLAKEGKVGFINKKGETIIPFKFDDDYTALLDFKFINGHSVVCKNQRYGVINKKGEIIVPIDFIAISFFDGKEVLGFKEGKWELVRLND